MTNSHKHDLVVSFRWSYIIKVRNKIILKLLDDAIGKLFNLADHTIPILRSFLEVLQRKNRLNYVHFRQFFETFNYSYSICKNQLIRII